MIFRDDSFSQVAISYPSAFNSPDIISESAMLAEHPYASIHTFFLLQLSPLILSGSKDFEILGEWKRFLEFLWIRFKDSISLGSTFSINYSTPSVEFYHPLIICPG